MVRPTSACIDAQIQAYVSSGDHQRALELAARAYVDTVFRYCFRMLNADATRARDVTQQVFEAVCKGIGRYRGDASARTWLLAIAHHQCRKEIDTQQRRRAILRRNRANVAARAQAQAPAAAEATAISREGQARLQWALQQLDPEARSILIMRFGVGIPHELSAAEIANVLGLSRAAAYRKLQDALQRLRRSMDDDTA